MTFPIERVRALLCVAAVAAWLTGGAACIADNKLGFDTEKPDAGDSATPDGGDTGPLVQYTAISYDSTNDQLVVGLVGGVKFFGATDGHKVREMAFGTGLTFVVGRAGGMFTADRAPDGSIVATGDWNGRVHLFRTATGAELAWPAWPEAESSGIDSVRFSPDGAFLAAG